MPTLSLVGCIRQGRLTFYPRGARTSGFRRLVEARRQARSSEKLPHGVSDHSRDPSSTPANVTLTTGLVSITACPDPGGARRGVYCACTTPTPKLCVDRNYCRRSDLFGAHGAIMDYLSSPSKLEPRRSNVCCVVSSKKRLDTRHIATLFKPILAHPFP